MLPMTQSFPCGVDDEGADPDCRGTGTGAAKGGPLGAGDGPFGTADGPFGTGDGPFGTADGPFGTGDGPFGTVDGPFGVAGGPFDTGMGILDAGEEAVGCAAGFVGVDRVPAGAVPFGMTVPARAAGCTEAEGLEFIAPCMPVVLGRKASCRVDGRDGPGLWPVSKSLVKLLPACSVK